MNKRARISAHRPALALLLMKGRRHGLAALSIFRTGRCSALAALLLLLPFTVRSQSAGNRPGLPIAVRAQDLEAGKLESNWLTYYGDYSGRRYSSLAEITPANVARLRLQWVFHVRSATFAGAAPVAVGGIVYIATSSDVYAVDGRSGAMLWRHTRQGSGGAEGGAAARPNRGIAIFGSRLYLTTEDAHLLCLDARSGNQLWEVAFGERKDGSGPSSSPLIVRNKVIFGVTVSDSDAFIAALSADDGKQIWRFEMDSAPNGATPSNEGAGQAHCGSAVWMPGTYDSVRNTIYWTTGPSDSTHASSVQPGGDAASGCLLALDAEDGKLKWAAHIAPRSQCAAIVPQVPVLVNTTGHGAPRGMIAVADRNGLLSVYDRESGKLLSDSAVNCSGAAGPAISAAPSYSEPTRLFYGLSSQGAGLAATNGKNGSSPAGENAIVAYNLVSKKIAWKVPSTVAGDFSSGLLTTSTGLLFLSDGSQSLKAADAATGKPLWSFTIGQTPASPPISYAVDGKQFVIVTAGKDLFAFALP